MECYDAADELTDMGYLVSIFGDAVGASSVVAQGVADVPGDASYTPLHSFNAGGGAVTATRTDEGTYAMTFGGSNFNAGAHVQVNAYLEGRHCNVAAWAGDTVNVTCTHRTGVLTDTPYAITVLQED